MKVSELREMLAGMDGDLPVVVVHDNGVQQEIVRAKLLNQLSGGYNAIIEQPHCAIMTRKRTE